jgi:hypothetical protein
MDKNLPIKFFSKRTLDERDTEGAGGPPPGWVLVGDLLSVRAGELIKELQKQSVVFEQKKTRKTEFIPAVLQLEIKEDAIAKSYRSDIGSLFSDDEADISLIGFKGKSEVLVKLDNLESLNRVIKRLSQPQKYRYSYGISAISDVKAFEAEKPESIGQLDGKSIEVNLINFQNYKLNKAIELLFEEYCRTANINVKRLNYSPELINYKLTGITSKELPTILEFDALKEIEFMPEISISFDELTDSTPRDLPLKEPEFGKEYPTVGVLDSGIASIDRLRPWLLTDNFSVYPESNIDRGHGTFVAGIIVYGDGLEGQLLTGTNGCYLYDAIVMPKEKVDLDELIANIIRAVESRPDIRVWNLSLGTKIESNPYKFSKFGIALDEVQRRFNVIIAKSAGNCLNFLSRPPRPAQRISESADTLRSVVVGSLAHAKGLADVAEIHHPSPFSRVGKGPCHINKPDLVHYGGNAGSDGTGRLKKNGVNSFTTSNAIAADVGTSFSTPRVSSTLAAIEASIDEPYDPLLIKALAIHSARYPIELTLPPREKLRQAGFGVPAQIKDIMYNSPDEITLILQDNLEKGQYIEIGDFPFPQSMTENGYYYGEIIVTLVASPLVDPNNGVEYCQSNLEVKLGTYDSVVNKDMKKPRNKNEIGLQGTKNLLHNATYGSRFKNSNVGDFSKERMLINYGDKYQPVKKYGINLDELTPASKEGFLKAPKKWYLKITGYYRDFIAQQAKLHGEALSQEFCIVITIRDRKKADIYSEVTQLLTVHNFVHNNIRIRSDVRVSVV